MLVRIGTPPWAWANAGHSSSRPLVVIAAKLNGSADSFVHEFGNFGSRGHGSPRSGLRVELGTRIVALSRTAAVWCPRFSVFERADTLKDGPQTGGSQKVLERILGRMLSSCSTAAGAAAFPQTTRFDSLRSLAAIFRFLLVKPIVFRRARLFRWLRGGLP